MWNQLQFLKFQPTNIKVIINSAISSSFYMIRIIRQYIFWNWIACEFLSRIWESNDGCDYFEPERFLKLI